MLERMNRASTMMIALFAASACLAACGDSGGGTGGNGGQGSGGSTTSTTSGSTTSGTTTSSSTSSSTTAVAGCLELCEMLNECPNVQQANCPVDCPPVEAFNATAMCAPEYQAFVACVIVSAAPCQASNSECQTQASEYYSCTSDFCAVNPADPNCP